MRINFTAHVTQHKHDMHYSGMIELNCEVPKFTKALDFSWGILQLAGNFASILIIKKDGQTYAAADTRTLQQNAPELSPEQKVVISLLMIILPRLVGAFSDARDYGPESTRQIGGDFTTDTKPEWQLLPKALK